MDFLIKNTKGLTLKTKGKYCTEDLVIEIDPSLVEGYMEIDELPEVGLPRVLYKVMLEEPEYYIWENDEWVKISGSDPNLQEKEITENGEYVADEGYDGFSKVTVNVASSGGGGIIEVEELPTTNIDSNAFYKTPRKFTNVYYKITKYNTGTFLTLSGIKINGTEVVETKPTTNIIQSNLATYECYLYYVKTENDIFVYLNAGAGLQWYNLAAIFALLQVGNLTFIGETDGTRSQVETELGYYAYFEDEKYYKEKENNLTEYADRNSILSRFFSGLQLEPLDLFVNISSMPLNYFKNVNTEYFKITFTVSGTTNFTDYYNSLGQNGFRGCSAKTIYLTNLEPSVQLSIGYDVFIDCKNLTSLVLDFASILSDIETTEFSNTPIANGNGYIYVRDELVDTVKAMTNWSAYANQIKPLSEYVEE